MRFYDVGGIYSPYYLNKNQYILIFYALKYPKKTLKYVPNRCKNVFEIGLLFESPAVVQSGARKGAFGSQNYPK